MPNGVSESFLHLAHRERRRSLATLAFLLPVAWVGFFLAELADDPAYGDVTRAYVVLVLVGVILGLVWARHLFHGYARSLREEWRTWMDQARFAETLPELAHRARTTTVYRAWLAAAAATFLLAVNAGLFTVLWIGWPHALVAGFVVTGATGLAIGLHAAFAVWTYWFCSSFITAAAELAREGRLALFGERGGTGAPST